MRLSRLSLPFLALMLAWVMPGWAQEPVSVQPKYMIDALQAQIGELTRQNTILNGAVRQLQDELKEAKAIADKAEPGKVLK